MLSCDLWEYADPSAPISNRAPETYLTLAAAETLYSRIESGEVKALNLILKTDVQGSIEPVRNSLENLNTERSRVNVIHASSGSITESDVLLAVASQAIIICFNSPTEPVARSLAGQEGVEVRFYDVIYNVADDEPVTQHDFFAWLSELLGKPMPPAGSRAPGKRARTHKRVANGRLRALGWQLKYPTFREGYSALRAAESANAK